MYIGKKFPFQSQPGGQGGGMMSSPLSGIVNGFITTLGGWSNNKASIVVSSGEAILDGQRCRLASQLTISDFIDGLTAPTSDGSLDYGPFTVFLVPLRKVKAGTANPPSSGNNGDLYIKVEEFTDPVLGVHYKFLAMYERRNNGWVEKKDVINAPEGQGFNRSPFTDLAKEDVDADFFSLSPEKSIYLPYPGPSTVVNRGMVLMRPGASVPIANFKVRVTRSGNNVSATMFDTKYYTEFETIR